eukprot:TRINITY_DN8234_c0_g1_i1.p1 TRINITY_DN8234_c0_g1~~TRINITY_DN8234_c0_g1_i1.p1  ORF type:complete len:354 (-),score=40.00 TRINITY_DN8234_c0_g1_i1:1096-2112(-)
MTGRPFKRPRSEHTLLSLDDDCLWTIFQELPCKQKLKLCAVCKRFRLLVLQNLEELSFENLSLPTGVVLNAMSLFPRLNRVRLPQFTDELPIDQLPLLAKTMSTLRFYSADSDLTIKDVGLMLLGANASLLEVLDLPDCWSITDVGIEHVANGCPFLREVNVPFADLSDVGLRAIAAGCTRLQKLVIGGNGISDAGLCAIFNQCHQLSHLALDECTITDVSLNAMASNGIRLKHFTVSNGDFTVDGFSRLALCLDNAALALRSMVLFDRVLLGLANASIEVLTLEACSQLTDAGLIEILRACRSITSLDVTNCPQVTEPGVAYVSGFLDGKAKVVSHK